MATSQKKGRGKSKKNVTSLPQPNPYGIVAPNPYGQSAGINSYGQVAHTGIGQQNASAYKILDPVQHVLTRPEMYIGSVRHAPSKEWHFIDGKVLLKQTTEPFALRHIPNELCSNVADNRDRSILARVDPGECVIEARGAMFTITNSGLAMPIEIDPKSGLYIPEMCFGSLLAGSNFDDDISSGGANGLGAKVMIILAKWAQVEVLNPVSHKSYIQQWTDNARNKVPALVQPYSGTVSMVRVSYVIDHERLNYPAGPFAYSESALQIFHWRAASLSFTANIPVTFNGQRMHFDLLSYAQLYTSSPIQRAVMVNRTTSNGVITAVLIDAPREGKQIGFANHIVNTEGGLHIKHALGCIKKAVVTDKLKKSPVKITNQQIKAHIIAIISITGISNPRPDWANGQTKTRFNGPLAPFELSSAESNDILANWRVAQEISHYSSSRAFKDLGVVADADKRGRRLKLEKVEDANWAGTQYSHLCSLWEVEGDSAEGCWTESVEHMPYGKDANGVQVLMGKFINVATASQDKIRENKELNEFMKAMNLKYDTNYLDPKNKATLRYGRIVFFTDADIDGTHISALLLNMLNTLFPTLLCIPGFVVDFMTPYLRGWHKDGRYVKFYYERQFEAWKAGEIIASNNDLTGWTFKYYKGLGSIGPAEIAEDQRDKMDVAFDYDEEGRQRILLALGGGDKHATALRKQWIRAWKPEEVPLIIHNKFLKITHFIDYFLRAHAVHSLIRHIPRLSSGCTDVQGKIIYGAFRVWGRKCTRTKPRKIPDFAGPVGEYTQYHHGDSIEKSIINMGQTHIGSNNVPLLIGEGRFGTIDKGGKHAAQSRYLTVKPSPLLPLLFRPEDDVLLDWKVEEGQKVEPVTYYCIVPLALFNGTKCVSTGSVSEIHACDPLEVIDQLAWRLSHNRPFTNLQVKYKGYGGDTYMEDNKMVSRGRMNILPDGSVEITCLPIGIWNRKYKEDFLDKQLFDGKIADYDTQSTANRTYFKVKGVALAEGEQLTEKRMQVIRKKQLNNLTLLDAEGWPVVHPNTASIQESFYQERLPLFGKRREAMVRQFTAELGKLRERRAYIQAYLDGKFDFRGLNRESRERADIIRDILSLGLNALFYKSEKKKKRTAEEQEEEQDNTPPPLYTEVKQKEMDRVGIAKLNAQEAILLNKIQETSAKSNEEMWLSDLRELRAKIVELDSKQKK